MSSNNHPIPSQGPLNEMSFEKKRFYLKNLPRKSLFFVWESNILDFGYIGRFSANFRLLTLNRSNFAHFFASGHISIIFLPCSCKHLTLVAKKKNWKNSKLLENTCLFWRSILVTAFNENLNFSTQKLRSLEILFAYENMFHSFIFMFIFWGQKLSLSWRIMSILFLHAETT